ncbi:MAG: carbohydrate ABC transporter permease [Candidatus Magasanikbacteria bacterium]|jgi:putative aldouronate transport system permease protein|nr:carbohydrate ABC transporter permease [Candidatus Magasanikbacteria bacterium]
MQKTSVVKRRNRLKQSKGDRVFDAVSITLLLLFSAIVAYPLIYVVSASFSSTNAVIAGQVWLWPVEPSVEAYKAVFSNASILTGYKNAFIYTVGSTVLTLIMTVLCGFSLSRKDFYGRNVFSGMILFTMLFSGGLIPTYMLIKDLGMLDTIWPLILPNAVWPWFIILARTYMSNAIPEELYESASLDGCSVFGMLWNITLPLSGAILAVVALYCAVGNWNSYFDAFIYLSKPEMYPLQVVLRNILILNSMDIGQVADLRNMATRQGMSNLLKYAVIVVSSAPLLILYPFVQKYFVKGVMVGSVKG